MSKSQPSLPKIIYSRILTEVEADRPPERQGLPLMNNVLIQGKASLSERVNVVLQATDNLRGKGIGGERVRRGEGERERIEINKCFF